MLCANEHMRCDERMHTRVVSTQKVVGTTLSKAKTPTTHAARARDVRNAANATLRVVCCTSHDVQR